MRLFNVAVTRAQTRLYVIGSRERIRNAKSDTALAHLGGLLGSPGVRCVPGAQLISPPAADDRRLGVFGSALADVLSRHVEVAAVHDETTFYEAFHHELRTARSSIWLWAPWVAQRVRTILPLLREASDRGVRVTVFIRDDTDKLQGRPKNQKLIAELRAVAHTVVPVNYMHQKIVVIDEKTVMLGSLNTLSQRWTREVMVTMRGGHFARKLLEHEHADLFAGPPQCGRCGDRDSIELRRRTNGIWFWRCYDTACKAGRNGRSNAWNQDIRLGAARR
ncbi:phospholipase D-like domain-containing protein [Streptomyces otsuchiensis]|uniref:phospholipase D-like domain-containing protein n=1 Tax=Streptomyces otsuchiensis TaxID=2681388 RepID=UPI001D130DF6|nr:phospholipase D-like domain-containing protein [Streptomyces otsuchiensis]